MTDVQIDILKTATEWAKAEMLSSAFFALCGLACCLISYGLWHYGRTDTAKAYVIPLLVVGALLIILGVGLIISNQLRLAAFPEAFQTDAAAFLASELARASKTISGYQTAIYRVLPLITLIAAGLLFFVKAPIWQASCVSTIAMMAVILVIDTNATARMVAYHQALTEASPAHQNQ